MPSSRSIRSRTERGYADESSRRWADALVGNIYRFGTAVIGLSALGVTVYAFTESFGEGARSIVFFMIPAMWGAYFLATRDGEPQAILGMRDSIATGLAVTTALVVSAVWIISAPIALVNLVLGMMQAFFFMIRIASQSTRHVRRWGAAERLWARTFLIVLTMLGIVASVKF